MKMKKYIVLFVATAFLGTGCEKKYQEGIVDGEVAGQSEGNADGYDDGYNTGYTSAYNSSYTPAFADGKDDGIATGLSDGQAYYTTHDNYGDGFTDGWSQGYSSGSTNGYNDAYTPAYNAAYSDGYVDAGSSGYSDGYSDGYGDNYNSGYDSGDADGYADSYDIGYSDGYDDNYSGGYSDGYYDGYDAAIGSNVKTSNPTVKIAAMVNQDLFDYTKMQKFNSASVLEGGSIALSHADTGTVDMEKLASLKEQHYLNQMASQIQAKFGLSNERSQSIATVAHQFNKLAGTRELTEKDSDVFAMGVIGTNIKDIQGAVTKSLKGDSSDLDVMLAQIARHNDTTPENVSSIIGQIFF